MYAHAPLYTYVGLQRLHCNIRKEGNEDCSPFPSLDDVGHSGHRGSLRKLGREESGGIVRCLKTSLGVSKCLGSVHWLRILKYSIGLIWRLIEINTGFSAGSFLLACV